ncbi:MAG: flagellar protein FlaG [Pseudomonadota bacterium]
MKPELTTTVLTNTPTVLTNGQGKRATQPTPISDADIASRVGLAVETAAADKESEASVAELDSAQLAELVEALNSKAANIARQLRFQFDDDANTSVIQVYDRETDELIRQIPSEEVLERMRFANSDALSLIDTEA